SVRLPWTSKEKGHQTFCAGPFEENRGSVLEAITTEPADRVAKPRSVVSTWSRLYMVTIEWLDHSLGHTASAFERVPPRASMSRWETSSVSTRRSDPPSLPDLEPWSFFQSRSSRRA